MSPYQPFVGLFMLSGILCLPTFTSANDQAPANSELAVDQSFDADDLDSNWHVNTGKWEIVEGVLHAKEVASDNHSAAARYKVETENAVYQLRFKIVGEGKAFHFGFDPAPGELDKKGHLFSIVITPKSWRILKHVDKKRPQEDPSETLASQTHEINRDQWHDLRVATWGNHVTATIDGQHKLTAMHPSFGVRKPTLVFRCIGDGVQIDDIKVWRQLR